MKIQKIYVICALLLSVGALLNARNYSDRLTTGGKLEKEGDELFVSYTLNVAREAVRSCQTLYITPQLISGSDILSFPPVVIKGKARNQAYERWVALNGRQRLYPAPHAELTVDSRRDREVDFSAVVAFEPWMEAAELRFEERVFYCGAEEAVTYRRLTGLEKANTAEPVIQPNPVHEAQKPVEVYREKEGVAYITFEQGRSIIRPMYDGNRKELANIAEVIRSIEEDESAKITGIVLTGYASPEGSEMVNYDLSRKRTDAVMQFINEEFDLWLPQRRMKTYSEGEDWEGLRRMVEENYIPYRKEVMDIIDSRMNADEKEYRLRLIAGGEVYRILMEDFYPQLRRTRYVIQYQVKE